MAGRFNNPFPQFLDATPEVRSGAKLFFYAAGTSTKLNTYSDRTLSSANTNPVVLNSAGYPSVDIYLQDLDYKVVLAPSTDTDPPASPIWTADYVNARDSKLIAKTVTGTGSPNGSVAGTAGSASILPDFYWDYTNSILYVCTTTGTSSTAVWTAINASSATASVPPPQGRLTPTSATPVINATAAVTSIFYTPYIGNLVPIYNGATMVPTEFSELQLALVSAHAASTIYDVFVFSNSGVLTLVTGPAWSTSTAGSGARGSGASTTQLTRIKGLYVNAVSMTGRNGSTTYTVGANLGTYVGSLYIDSTPGQATCHADFGSARKWAVWNAYNRAPVTLIGTSTSSGSYSTATFRAFYNDTNNSMFSFVGLPEEQVLCTFQHRGALPNVSSTLQIGIGVNSATVATASSLFGIPTATGWSGDSSFTPHVSTTLAPGSIGANRFYLLEYSSGGVNWAASTMDAKLTWRA